MRPGDDLAALLAAAAPADLADGDVLVVAHKVVSKAEGRIRDLAGVHAGRARARAARAEHGKDPRLVQVVLDESAEVLRAERGVLVCVTRHGFVCANAGVDRSNVPGEDSVVLLPEDPDALGPAPARRDRRRARGAAGRARDRLLRARLAARPDRRGHRRRRASCRSTTGPAAPTPTAQELRVTAIAVADAAAAAADLARAKDSREPAVLVRGLERFVSDEDGPGAAPLRRPREEDLFR